MTILSSGSTSAGTQFLGLAADTVTAPSFSWTDDSNTGIYHPGADKLGLVTAGVERVSVLDNGNVGIGTTNPQAKLDVAGSIIATGSAAPPGYIPTAISNYEEFSFTANLAYSLAAGAYIGGGATTVPTIKVVRLNNLIHMYISAFQVYLIGSANFFQTTSVPSRFKPLSVYHEFLVRSFDNGRITSLLTISAGDGAMNWYRGTSFEGFPGGSGTMFSFLPASISYIL